MSHDRLELELRELAAGERWPPTPDLADRVVALIAAPPEAATGASASAGGARTPAHAPGRRWRPARLVFAKGPALVAAVILTLLIAGALVPPVRSAVLDVLGIAGRESIVRVPGPPDTSRPELDFGERTTLRTAQRRLSFTIRLPRALGSPREVRYSDAIAGGAVTLIYPDFALLQIEGGTDPVLQKQLGRGSSIRAVNVAGAPGAYIRGAHELAVLDRDGRYIPATRSFVRGDVLVWQSGRVAYRLETRAGLQRALDVARSVR
jgi:hypothetical protein